MVELQLGRQKWAGEAKNATFWPDPEKALISVSMVPSCGG